MDSFVEMIQRQVESDRRDQFEDSPQVDLGYLIDQITTIFHNFVAYPEPRVFLDNDTPTNLHSWRGIYRELAFDYQDGGDGMTITDFLKELKFANGMTYQGYKGGDFLMERGTPVWVSHYGTSGDHRAVVAVEHDREKNRVTVVTKVMEP